MKKPIDIDGEEYNNPNSPLAQEALLDAHQGVIGAHRLSDLEELKRHLADRLRAECRTFQPVQDCCFIGLPDLAEIVKKSQRHELYDVGWKVDGRPIFRVRIGGDMDGWILEPYDDEQVLLYAPLFEPDDDEPT